MIRKIHLLQWLYLIDVKSHKSYASLKGLGPVLKIHLFSKLVEGLGLSNLKLIQRSHLKENFVLTNYDMSEGYSNSGLKRSVRS